MRAAAADGENNVFMAAVGPHLQTCIADTLALSSAARCTADRMRSEMFSIGLPDIGGVTSPPQAPARL